jgi:hypothetical protein
MKHSNAPTSLAIKSIHAINQLTRSTLHFKLIIYTLVVLKAVSLRLAISAIELAMGAWQTRWFATSFEDLVGVGQGKKHRRFQCCQGGIEGLEYAPPLKGNEMKRIVMIEISLTQSRPQL